MFVASKEQKSCLQRRAEVPLNWSSVKAGRQVRGCRSAKQQFSAIRFPQKLLRIGCVCLEQQLRCCSPGCRGDTGAPGDGRQNAGPAGGPRWVWVRRSLSCWVSLRAGRSQSNRCMYLKLEIGQIALYSTNNSGPTRKGKHLWNRMAFNCL